MITNVNDRRHKQSDDPHFGLILALTINGLAIGDYREMVRVAQLAERYRFDSIWTCDHFLTLSPDDYVKDAGIGGNGAHSHDVDQRRSLPLLEGWTALSALARDTSTLRLGTSVLCNSYRYPSVLAKMAATLDVISNGRLDLGIGAGWFQQEFDAYGIPFPSVGDRVSALAESLDVLKAVWTQSNPVYSGHFYTLDGAVCDPPPLQTPHPPLWVGGEGDRVQRIAARAAQGLNVRWWSPEKVLSRKEFLNRACESVGREPETLRLSLTALLAPTESAAQEEQIRAEFASIPETGLIVGPIDKCIDRINEYRRSGIDHFLFAIPHVASSEYLAAVGESIIPQVKRTVSIS